MFNANTGGAGGGYNFLRYAKPTSPTKPEPKSQKAAGSGTAVGYSIM